MDELKIILSSYFKVYRSPSWALRLIRERVYPAIVRPDAASRELSKRKDVGLAYGLETGTVTVTFSLLACVLFAYMLGFLIVFSFSGYSLEAFGSSSVALFLMLLWAAFMMVVSLVLGPMFILFVISLFLVVFWWIGRVLGGSSDHGRFYGVVMPAAAGLTFLLLVYNILAEFILLYAFYNILIMSAGGVSDVFKVEAVYMAGLLLIEIYSIVALSRFAANAHKITLGRALASCLLTLSPLILLQLMSIIMLFMTYANMSAYS